MDSSGFGRLHPALQHALVHDLGWRSLRPVQELTIDAVLDGDNTVVLAPTAGGKTEASFFPVLSQILTEERPPVAALHVCPIRALLNNQEERLQRYARMVGLDVFKWHGDVAASVKQRFHREPAHVLMITPESLEVLLVSARTDARALFAGLGAVIVDEVHAFAADDRGAHLMALLERLVQLCQRDLQRIGLSATVGNPRALGHWLQGSSRRPFRLIDPPRARADRDLQIDLAADVGTAARGIAQLGRGRKSLVFVESRSKAEQIAHALQGGGVEVFIHHSSVSRQDRLLAEERFTRGTNTAIVATSTMELGIDVGDLDQVLQVEAPRSVASFLQRLGRTGRRPGTRARCIFFCLGPESLLQAVAVCRLAERGWVEDIVPPERALHVLAHQVMALSLQEGGISRHRVLGWLAAAYPFQGLREEHLGELIDTMVARGILYEGDGLLSLGQRGEMLYGRKNFFELYAVFTAPPVLKVMQGKDEVGHIDAYFVQGHDGKQGPLCFRLAGRAWQAVHVDWNKGILEVRPAAHGQVPSWLGTSAMLSQPLCEEMRATLFTPGPESAWLTPSAAQELVALREGYAGLLEPGTAPLEDHGDQVQWHTFAGGSINRLLAAGLESMTGDKWVAGNLTLKAKQVGLVKAREAIHRLVELDWEAQARAKAEELARGRLSKFQPCLPPAAEDRLLVDKLLDVSGTLRFLAHIRVGAERLVKTSAEAVRVDISAELELVTFRPMPGLVTAYHAHLPIVWVASPAALAEACHALGGEPVVGLDVETTLDSQVLCLLQLATHEQVVLIDALALESLEPLRPLFENPDITKVIHNASFEQRILAKEGIGLRGVFDTLQVSRSVHGREALGGHTLGAVCERELGFTLDKGQQTSNWARRPLLPEQLRYAAADAEVLLLLHERLSQHTAPNSE